MAESSEPWRMPCSDKKGEEEKPGKHRLVDLSKRKKEVKLTSHREIYLFLRLQRSRTGTTVSKAQVIFKKSKEVSLLSACYAT
jgi:hypothetical protein